MFASQYNVIKGYNLPICYQTNAALYNQFCDAVQSLFIMFLVSTVHSRSDGDFMDQTRLHIDTHMLLAQ